MTIDQANEIVGGLSKPSKMPCYSFSTPAARCITGGKLSQVENSVCAGCYAVRGNYRFPAVKNAQEKRFENLNHPDWVAAMSFLINSFESSGFFRWHDSGDLQSVAHLSRIVQVCKATPNIRHWLPTREVGIVSDYLAAGNTLPDNLTVRLSAFMIDGIVPVAVAQRLGLVTSAVTRSENFTCPSSKQGGKCLTCRACWDKGTANVTYKKH